MKLTKIIQFFLVIFFVLLWSFTIYGVKFQKKTIADKTDSIPIYLFSYSQDILETINDELKDNSAINEMILNSNEVITENLLKKYDLTSLKAYIDEDKLPHILFLSPNNNFLQEGSKDEIFSLFDEYQDNLIINFNQDEFNEIIQEYRLFNSSIFYINLSFALVVLFLTIFFQAYNQLREKNFREIYLAAGGDPKNLHKKFWYKTTVYLFFIAVLNFAFIFVFTKQLNLKFEYENFILQLITLLFAFFFTKKINKN